MLEMAKDVDQNAKPLGRRRSVTVQWITAAQVALDAQLAAGATRKKIAKKCGTSGPYITQLLQGKYETSHFLDCLSRELGIAVPPMIVETVELQDLVTEAQDLAPDVVTRLADFIRDMKTKK